MTGRRIDRAVVAVTLVALAAAVGTAVAGFVLLEVYRPAFAEAWTQSAPLRSSSRWLRFHELAATTALVASAVVFVIGAVATRAGDRRIGAAAMLGAVVSGVGGVVALVTRSLVAFEQLGLYAVTVGEDIAGYRIAAFDDGVRFVIVDGTEVAPGDYAVSLVVHLAAPVVGALALGAALAVVVARRRRERAAAPVGEGSLSRRG